ncbi:MAG: dihydroneopterin aldolase [Chloroflexi bacterium]|nr:MAG: dihydroneopterin aldolase [Chloroflexota bacterium]
MSGDRLLLEGMEFYGFHGDIDAERALGGRFRVDVELRADLRAAGRSDSLVDTLDYVRCFQLVREVVEDRQYRLLEAVAQAIADALLEQPRAEGVRVRVAKQPPLRGGFDTFAVVIERARPAGAVEG